MTPGIIRIVLKSITFYRKPVIYQVLIITLLSAVITGSLLTGDSVRESLKRSASERLGNTGVVISSGVRYFDVSLSQRIKERAGISNTPILEMSGYCQNFNSQKGAFNTHIYGIQNDFFLFNGTDSIVINKGEVAINRRLADYLDLKSGDDLIIRFRAISDIPADAPFAQSEATGTSVVMKIGSIIEPEKNGNFSLAISQIVPMNLFMNLSDIQNNNGDNIKANRLLVERKTAYSLSEIIKTFQSTLVPSDIGLRIRQVKALNTAEIISDRVFIDEAIVNEISTILPSSAPVLTYLGNRFKAGSRSAPYSFVSALPVSVYPEATKGNGIIINNWLAADLDLNTGDTLNLSWYTPDSLNKLTERNNDFIVNKIVEISGRWGDSLLMPEFPGIAGSESCSEWDAGIPIKMGEIRDKDEEYWNKYRGTPKAFINYETGKKLWGNNFGPATAIRFPAGTSVTEIDKKLSGSLDPSKSGFSFTDISAESVNAAGQGVDFGTLFLSLGFFLIVASIVLLSFVITSYFDTKLGQIKTLYALGFKNRLINRLLFLESGLIGLIGSLIGAFSGFLVCIVITNALNSVWRGAVQTDTLGAHFNLIPVLTGGLITFILIMFFTTIRIKRYLKVLSRKITVQNRKPASGFNLLLLLLSTSITISVLILALIISDSDTALFFTAGTFLLITLILLWRQFYLGKKGADADFSKPGKGLSELYYSYYPSHAITPILFIAAGIFAVFITGANKMNFNENQSDRSSGTGGYLLWCDNTIPVKEDLNSDRGRITTGIDEEQLSEMSFIQIKRSSGNDASCLNLNHITSPPLLGVDPTDFIQKKSFSFAKAQDKNTIVNPWQYLLRSDSDNTIYGIADQTVLEWGLKLKIGDTLIIRVENGLPLNIIIAAGLKSSVFQGYVLIGKDSFLKYFPSVSGSSILLVDGDNDKTEIYRKSLTERLENYGVNIERTTDRLASFYEVTNTYLSVFGVFGALGMITGIAGLGFILLRNYNNRKKEFALMLATGFSVKRIKRIILREQLFILFAGVSTGVISAIIATMPSIRQSPDIQWLFLTLMVLAVVLSGLTALYLSVRSISSDSLRASLKKE